MKKLKTIIISALCVILPLIGQAGLVSTINTDTVTDVDIDWSWDPEVASDDTPALANWYLFVSAVESAATGEWLMRLELLHKAIPHATESVPPITYKNYAFSIASDFGIVINDTFDVAHPGEGHIDSYSIVLDRSPTPSLTTLTIQGVHQIPEPNSILLLGLAGGAIGSIRRLLN